MQWEKLYKTKVVSVHQAVAQISNNDHIVIGHAVGAPDFIIDTMVQNASNYRNVKISHMVCTGQAPYCAPELVNNFTHLSLFVSASTRRCIEEGRGEFIPCNFSKVPELYRDSYLPVDVALIMVSPPDNHGYCSLGVSVDYTKQAAKSARITIAQVNQSMPRTLGDAFIHIDEIDYLVEHNSPLFELPSHELSEEELNIGRYCATLIEDGSTLQLGIGSLPDAVLLSLKDKKDLGIHSEMISDGVVELIEAGVVTNRKKTLHKGKNVVTFLMGTKRLYDFVDNNPSFYMAPVDYTNSPIIIAKNDKMVSINSCVQIDLMGQIVAESIGSKQISSVGGQADFIRGASYSKGGKAIIAIQSTAKGGTKSKIVPFLDPESSITTPRFDVDYVVTEFGIAPLKGKSLLERAKALIKITHPDHREALIKHFEKKFHCKYTY